MVKVKKLKQVLLEKSRYEYIREKKAKKKAKKKKNHGVQTLVDCCLASLSPCTSNAFATFRQPLQFAHIYMY